MEIASRSEFEDERPPVLTAPDVPGTGMIKRGALKALIRHSGMSPEEFEIYAQTEDRMTQARAAITLQSGGSRMVASSSQERDLVSLSLTTQ